MKLLQYVVAIALILSLIACGGSSIPPEAAKATAVPVANDPQLISVWNRAAQYLANNNILLNAAAMVTQPGTTADIYPPDQRALDATYTGVTVTTVQDLTVAQLQAENPGVTLKHNTDPTGIVHCASNSEGAKYCASYVSGTSIYVASSLEYSDNADRVRNAERHPGKTRIQRIQTIKLSRHLSDKNSSCLSEFVRK
jgi:hypothetical protein